MTFSEKASANFQKHLNENPYPGRGVVIGKSEGGSWLLIYWIMGRSTNSRNRRFAEKNGILRTEPVDYSKVTDPSLIIYEAMMDLPGIHIVSNGDQTKTIYEAIQNRRSFQDALSTRDREPDSPNFTPRISGILEYKGSEAKMTLSVLKANEINPEYTNRYYYEPVIPENGYGYGVTTYSGDGDPLPSFSGDPLLLPVKGSAEEVLNSYWEALNSENRVSLAVKEILPDRKENRILIQNQY
ncbi:MAG: inosine monophosphate cyclohydrolase [Spirochaetes bacterium]|nr:inosine monophosphate cyclohydrolase [Spirochaetota bacterium]